MAITRTQAVSATANNVAIIGTTAGDLIVVWSYFAGTATIPSLAAGFTNVVATAGTGQAARLAYKVSTDGETTSGTWTNATQVVCHVYSGAGRFGTVPTITAGNSATLTYSAVTLIKPDGTSVILGFGGASSATAGMNGNPGPGFVLTNQTSQTKANGCDSVTTASGMSAQTLAVTTSGRWQTVTIELRTPNAPSLTAGFSPKGTVIKRTNTAGYVAILSPIGNFNKTRTFFRSFTSALFSSGTNIGVQTVTDSFNRANETPMAGNWTQDSGNRWDVTSNTAALIDGNTNTDSWAYYNPWTSGDNQYSQVKVTLTGGGTGDGPGVMVRKASGTTETFYRLTLGASAGGFELSKIVAGAFTSLRTGTVTYVSGTQLGLSVNGTTLKIWYGGVQQGTDVTDAAISTGFPGISHSGNSGMSAVSVDDWDAGIVSSGAIGTSSTLVRAPIKSFVATLLPTGAFRRQLVKVLGATLSFVGSLFRSTNKQLSAVRSFVGSITAAHFIIKSLTGALSFVGNLATLFTVGSHQYLQNLSGTLSFVGRYVKSTTQGLTGTLSFVGTLAHIYVKSLTAALSFTGTISRNIVHKLTGSLLSIGNFSSLFSHVHDHFLTVTASLDFVGLVTKSTRRFSTAVRSFVGNMRKTGQKSLSGVLFSTVGAEGSVWASTGTPASIQNLHDNFAVNGDTITIPAGSFTWTTTVSLSKRITLQGAGSSLTHVTDQGSGGAALGVACTAAHFVRVTGIEFIKSVANAYGMIQFGGPSNGGTNEVGFRFDHCKINFPTAGGRGIYVYGIFGLIDNNQIFVGGPGSQQTISVDGSSFGSDGGFTPWTRPLTLGTDKAVYVENNTFDYTGNDQAEDAIDMYAGARIVVRNNTFLSCTQGFHGTDSGGIRSPVSFEIYNNTYTNNSVHTIRALTVRGGTGVVFGNSYGGSHGAWFDVTLMYYRVCIVLNQPGAWQFCNGTVWELGSANFSDDASRECSVNGGFRFDATNKETVGAVGGSFTRGFDGTGSNGYPGRDQPGIGPGQVSEPIRVWNNGGVGPGTYGGGDPGDQVLLDALVASGRDYFYSADNSAARPGYVSYVYPHPAQMSASGGLTKQTSKALSAIGSFVGNLIALSSHVGTFIRSFSANLVFAGNINRREAKGLVATLSFVGLFTRGTLRLKSLTATLWGGVNSILDRYSETNVDATFTLPSSHGIGQTFNSGTGGTLDSSKFVLVRSGLPSGTIVSKLYASTGTFGTDSHPTGTALAVSDTIVATTLPTSGTPLTTFSFTGANRVIMSASTVYAIVVEYPSGTGGTIDLGRDQTSPSHAGNICILNFADVWAGQTGTDASFYVLIEGGGTTSVATLTHRTGKSFSAVRSFTGDLVRVTKKSLRSVLSFIGGLDTLFSGAGGFVLNLTSTLSFSGNFNRDSVRKLTASVLNFSAKVVKTPFKDLVAFRVASGSLAVTFGFQQLLTATLSFVGSLASSTPFRQFFTATLTFTSDFGRTFTKMLIANLLSVGRLTKQTSKFFRSTLSFIGTFIGNFVGDFRYYINLRPNEFKPTKTTFRTTESTSSNFRNVKTDDDS